MSMKAARHGQQGNDLSTTLSRPAQRALAGAGYSRLEQFTQLSEADILQLHGMGPKALEQIRCALAARGLSFAEGKKK
jgi:DNA-directed RNA polymerase alpha subunit